MGLVMTAEEGIFLAPKFPPFCLRIVRLFFCAFLAFRVRLSFLIKSLLVNRI